MDSYGSTWTGCARIIPHNPCRSTFIPVKSPNRILTAGIAMFDAQTQYPTSPNGLARGYHYLLVNVYRTVGNHHF